MRYITSISFPDNDSLIIYMNHHLYTDWPFKVFLDRGLNCINLNDITILYGNNGSGKSTILNVIGEKIKATRRKELFIEKIWNPPYGFYEPFKDYLRYVAYRLGYDKENGIDMRLPNNIRLITSDDIFSEINEIIKNNTISVGEADKAHYEYNEKRNEHYQLKGMYDFEEFSKRVQMKKMSNRQFIEKFSRKKYDLHSNGETALEYFDKMFEPNGIYLLDEPENCLSPIFQIKLMEIILNAKRFFNCQFIIATHSPLILSLPDATVYDLDDNPIKEKEWYELDNVRVYYEFFEKHKNKFLGG